MVRSSVTVAFVLLLSIKAGKTDFSFYAFKFALNIKSRTPAEQENVLEFLAHEYL